MDQSWPAALWMVRHGQSAAPGAEGVRAMDLPLSPLGEGQARALGGWFASLPPATRPGVVLASPYRRARQTAELVVAAGGAAHADREIVLDERLRDREAGILHGMSAEQVAERHPEQAALRHHLGEFYHRPPGGESWCDVLLRLRSALDTISLHYPGERVLVITHEVVVLCLRYLLEGLTEEEVLAVDRTHDVANCAVTSYLPGECGLELERFNFVAPLVHAGAPVTRRPDPTPHR